MKMRRERTRAHPDEDALLALVDDASSARAVVRRHVAGCSICARRVEELFETRSVLQAAAGRNQRSPQDLTHRALSQLRLRHTSIDDLNELFASLRALFVGFADIFIRVRPPSVTPTTSRAVSDDGAPRG